MKRVAQLFLLLALFVSPVMAAGGQATAVDIFRHTCGNGQPASSTDVCQSVHAQQGHNSANPIVNILKAAISVISYVVGAAAVIGIIASAIRFITSNGDSNAIASARTGLIYSLVGVAVVALAKAIVAFVLDKL